MCISLKNIICMLINNSKIYNNANINKIEIFIETWTWDLLPTMIPALGCF